MGWNLSVWTWTHISTLKYGGKRSDPHMEKVADSKNFIMIESDSVQSQAHRNRGNLLDVKIL